MNPGAGGLSIVFDAVRLGWDFFYGERTFPIINTVYNVYRRWPDPYDPATDKPPVGQVDVAAIAQALVLQGTGIPSPLLQAEGSESGVSVGESPMPETVVSPAVQPDVEFIDPDFNPTGTVYENAPGGIYEVEREPTDWDEYYRRYEELNYDAYEAEGDRAMWDWLQGATTLGQLGTEVGWWGGDSGLVAPAPALAPGGAQTMPARVTVDTRTGKITTCKRRRRRKLLTESDFNVLLRVATLPNKENVRIVLGKAIGRS